MITHTTSYLYTAGKKIKKIKKRHEQCIQVVQHCPQAELESGKWSMKVLVIPILFVHFNLISPIRATFEKCTNFTTNNRHDHLTDNICILFIFYKIYFNDPELWNFGSSISDNNLSYIKGFCLVEKTDVFSGWCVHLRLGKCLCLMIITFSLRAPSLYACHY